MVVSILENLIVHVWNWARGGGAASSHRRANTGENTKAARDSDETIVLGTTLRSRLDEMRRPRNAPEVVRMDVATRRKHIYLLGSTGSGKTNTVLTLIDHDLKHGRGVFLVDYRGDLYDRVLARLAAQYREDQLAKRLFLLDFRDQPATDPSSDAAPECVVGFDPLATARSDPYGAAFFILDVLRQQWGDEALGVRVEEGLRNCLLALGMTGGSLLDIEPLLVEVAFRRELLERVQDPQVLRFFERFESLSPTQREQWVNPILNKLTAWLARPRLRAILSNRDTIAFHELFESHPDAVVLVCLGADTLFQLANIMGCLVVNAVASALIRPERRETDHAVFAYLDEFENFTSLSERFASILAEGRKFGLGLTLSHQSSSQLDAKLRTLIRDIVFTQLFFSTGASDADRLADEITGQEPKQITKHRLMNQKVGEACLVRKGEPPVYIKTTHNPDPPATVEQVDQLRMAALRTFGGPIGPGTTSQAVVSNAAALKSDQRTPVTETAEREGSTDRPVVVDEVEPPKPRRRRRYERAGESHE